MGDEGRRRRAVDRNERLAGAIASRAIILVESQSDQLAARGRLVRGEGGHGVLLVREARTANSESLGETPGLLVIFRSCRSIHGDDRATHDAVASGPLGVVEPLVSGLEQ